MRIKLVLCSESQTLNPRTNLAAMHMIMIASHFTITLCEGRVCMSDVRLCRCVCVQTGSVISPNPQHAMDVVPGGSLQVRPVGRGEGRDAAETVVQQVPDVRVQPVDQGEAVVLPGVVLSRQKTHSQTNLKYSHGSCYTSANYRPIDI